MQSRHMGACGSRGCVADAHAHTVVVGVQEGDEDVDRRFVAENAVDVLAAVEVQDAGCRRGCSPGIWVLVAAEDA